MKCNAFDHKARTQDAHTNARLWGAVRKKLYRTALAQKTVKLDRFSYICPYLAKSEHI